MLLFHHPCASLLPISGYDEMGVNRAPGLKAGLVRSLGASLAPGLDALCINNVKIA